MKSVKNVACMIFLAMAVPIIGEGFGVADYLCQAANICFGEPKHEENSIVTCLTRTCVGSFCIAAAVALFRGMKKAREGQQTEQLFGGSVQPGMGKRLPGAMIAGAVGTVLVGIGLRALIAGVDC